MARDKFYLRKKKTKRAISTKNCTNSKKTHKFIESIISEIVENVEKNKQSTKDSIS
mgnify:CR=1 FL=1